MALVAHLLERQRLLLDFLIHLVVAARVTDQMRDDVLRGDLAITNRHEHGFRVGKVQLVGDAHQCFRSQQRGDWQVALRAWRVSSSRPSSTASYGVPWLNH